MEPSKIERRCICGSSRLIILNETEHYWVYHCNDCDLRWQVVKTKYGNK